MFSKLCTIVVLLLSFVCSAFSSISYSLPSVHPDYPGKCWYSDTMKAYDVGAVFTIPECTRVTCLENLGFEYATCGVVATSPPCRRVDGDLSLPYPDCCPTAKCD